MNAAVHGWLGGWLGVVALSGLGMSGCAAVSAGLSAAEGVITAIADNLQIRRHWHAGGDNPDMFAGDVALKGGPGIEVLGGSGFVVEAVDGAGASIVDRDYTFPHEDFERAPVVGHRLSPSDPASEARQGEVGPMMMIYFAPRGVGVVIARLHVRATVLVGDGSRTVVTIGTWPMVMGAHPDDLPGAPVIAADGDGNLSITIDETSVPRWRHVWAEVDGKPVANVGANCINDHGRSTFNRKGKLPDGAVIKAELTRIRGEIPIECTLGPWSFPGHGPAPVGVDMTVQVPDAK